MNQLRHAKFLRNLENIKSIMKLHGEYIRPKFDIAFKIFNANFGEENDFFRWTKPRGGYFMSLYIKSGYAKKVERLCREAGLILTPAGSCFPYGYDKLDTHIRFAPTYASLEEVEMACELISCVVKDFVTIQ